MTSVNQFRGLGFQDPPQSIAPYVGATPDFKAAPESFYGQCLNVAKRQGQYVTALSPLKDASMTQIVAGDLVFRPNRSVVDADTAQLFDTTLVNEVDKEIVKCGRILPVSIFSVFNGLPIHTTPRKMLSLYYANIFAGVAREGTPATTDATKPARINTYSSGSILSFINKLNIAIPNEALMTWAIFPTGTEYANWTKNLMSDAVWEQRMVTKACFVPISLFPENEERTMRYTERTMMPFVIGQNCGDVVMPGGRGMIRLN